MRIYDYSRYSVIVFYGVVFAFLKKILRTRIMVQYHNACSVDCGNDVQQISCCSRCGTCCVVEPETANTPKSMDSDNFGVVIADAAFMVAS